MPPSPSGGGFGDDDEAVVPLGFAQVPARPAGAERTGCAVEEDAAVVVPVLHPPGRQREGVVESAQSFKGRRAVGRYRQAYVYCCSRCGQLVEPGGPPADAAIDWSIPGDQVGDRLKPKTRARIAAGSPATGGR